MTSLVLAMVLALAISILIERVTEPPSGWLARAPSALAFRLGLYLFLFAFFFAWSWRPWSSAWALIWLVAALAAVSRAKHMFIGEPLAFTDLSFIADVFRHPKLFYTATLGPLCLLGLLASVSLSVYVCFRLEPHLLPEGYEATTVVAGCLAWFAALAVMLAPSTGKGLGAWVLSVKPHSDLATDVARDGSLATLALDWIGWRHDDRPRRISGWRTPAERMQGLQVAAKPADLIIVVQCELFLDLRRLGSPLLELPVVDAARCRAAAWGPLENACPGGYTLRSEFAFLTGESNASLGFDRCYPYLNAAPYAERAVPMLLKPHGYRSVYIHPYHAEFFNRHVALPAIGFDRLIMLEDFAGAPRVGDYVSDMAVAERVIAEADRASGRALLFAATMENHGPWVAGRFPGLDQPVPIFEQHLRNGNAMLGRLIEAFAAWPGRVVLVFYGDHVPLLKAFAHPFPDARTDYLLLELGRDAMPRRPGPERQLAIHDLTWEVLALAGIQLGGKPAR